MPPAHWAIWNHFGFWTILDHLGRRRSGSELAFACAITTPMSRLGWAKPRCDTLRTFPLRRRELLRCVASLGKHRLHGPAGAHRLKVGSLEERTQKTRTWNPNEPNSN